jgi:hypothetical protein
MSKTAAVDVVRGEPDPSQLGGTILRLRGAPGSVVDSVRAISSVGRPTAFQSPVSEAVKYFPRWYAPSAA